MARDIDYAAITVRTALVEKFGRQQDLTALEVEAKENTISVCHDGRATEGTRDNLLAAVRKADSLENFWGQFVHTNKSAR